MAQGSDSILPLERSASRRHALATAGLLLTVWVAPVLARPAPPSGREAPWAIPPAAAQAFPEKAKVIEGLLRTAPRGEALAPALADLAEALRGTGDYAAALVILRKRLEVAEESTPQDLRVAQAAGELGDLLVEVDRLEEADVQLRRALALREAAPGPEDEELANSLNSLGILCAKRGDYAGARSHYERAMGILEVLRGPEDQEVATYCNNLGILLKDEGDFEASRNYLRRALAIREKLMGPESAEVATVLNNTGLLLADTGQYAEAEKVLRRALAIREKVLGADHPRTGSALNNLALALFRLGEYGQARALFERTLVLREKQAGPESVRVATALGNLATVLETLGELDRAIEAYGRVLRIDQKVLGPDHPGTAQDLHNLALALKVKGDYAAARPLNERALAIREQALGADHPEVASTLSNLAQLLRVQGDLENARALEERALAIREKALGPWHPDLAYSLNNLGFAYADLGDGEAALRHFERALAIWEKAHGPNHDLVALGRVNVAAQLLEGGDLVRAEALLLEGLALDERVLGPRNRRVADDLNQVGRLRVRQGRWPEARTAFERALAVRREALGDRHPEVASALGHLVVLDLREGKARSAGRRALEAGTIVDGHLRSVLPSLSLAEQRAFLLERIPQQTGMLLAARSGARSNEAAYGLLFRWKGLLVESQRAQGRLVKLTRNPALRERVEALQSLKANLAGWFLKAGEMPAEEWRKTYDDLTANKEAAERALAREAPTAGPGDGFERVDLPTLRARLAGGEALVDLYRHPTWREGLPAPDRFTAVVLVGGRSPEAVDLGPARELESAARAWVAAARDGADAEGRWDSLRRRLWRPIQGALPRGTRRIWLSPDGDLARIPWHLFPERDALLTQVDSGREVVRLRAPQTARPEGRSRLLLAGDIDFGGDGGQFAPLPATLEEVQALARMGRARGMDVSVLSGPAAEKGAVASALEGATCVHLATHGFFYREAGDAGPGRGVASRGSEGGRGAGRNPMVESGIALARANLRDPTSQEALGLLTAEELVGMDLEACEMIVLSACDTGRGESVTGQGVQGLRGAALGAGARSMVLSLWQVPDEATRRLMALFYENLWDRRLPRAQALRAAQESLRDEPSGRFAAPVNWAGWTLVGEGWPEGRVGRMDPGGRTPSPRGSARETGR